ncbi:SlyX protein [Meridianimarinicoccus roseus]|uniref:SlyX protein n=1 Tax=Meridianimarinicoccus roseus TaxID=2072018 RepID=A0A2V2LD74_9RHOB|nr:SlyX family protein [Meridianimarinicoccus roseus]PWR01484.1 SlyX protein [Meridianimarinicoccus roseus]
MEKDGTDAMEERIAHLERALADVSDVVARQDREIAALTRRIEMLMQREAEREYASGGSVPVADRPPPHW